MKRALIQQKAQEFSQTLKSKEGSRDRRLQEQSFVKGALAIKEVLDIEVERLIRILEKGQSDFERGQKDGIFWVQSCIQEVFE